MKRTTRIVLESLLAFAVASAIAACKKDDADSESDEDEVADPATVLRLEGAWVNSLALTESESPSGLYCVTLAATPKACNLTLNGQTFAGDCGGFAGVEFACFPKVGDQIAGFLDFDVPLPAYGVGTLNISVAYDVQTLQGHATVVPEKTTAVPGAAPERMTSLAPDLAGAWQLTRVEVPQNPWTVSDAAPLVFFETVTAAEPPKVGFWDDVDRRTACAAGDAGQTALFLRQGDEQQPLRVDSAAHFDADVDQWFAGLSEALKTRLKMATRYLSRYTPRAPCELNGDCLDGDFSTLGPLDADTLRGRLATSLIETASAPLDCAAHTVPKNFSFMQCGPSTLRACDVVKLSMDAPLGLELGSKGVLEVGEPPTGSRFDASFEWLCPQTYGDLRRDVPDGADDVPAALLACRNEFLDLAPTAYAQAVLLEDWYNLSDMDYMLRCHAKGPTAEQQQVHADLSASCTPDLWRSSKCEDDGTCKVTITCPFGRDDGACMDQGAFVGNIAGRKSPLLLHLGSDTSFLLTSDTDGSATHAIDGVPLKCNQMARRRIYAVGTGDQLSGLYVDVSREACEADGEADIEPTAGDFFQFTAVRQP